MSFPWRRAAAFVACGAGALAVAYGVSEAVDPVYPQLKARLAHFRSHADGVEAVTVGNSHSRAIDFGVLEVRGMHLWMGGHDPFEAAYLARFAAREAPRLRTVLFAVSEGFQRADNALPTRTDRSARRRELYARTPLLFPMRGDADHWVAGKLAPLARADHWLGVVRRLKHPGAAVRVATDGSMREPTPPVLSRDSLERHGQGRSASHRAQGEETVRTDPTTPWRVAEELDALARGLRARGVTLVLYTPPFHESYLRAREPAVIAERWVVIAQVLQRSPNAVWLDFSGDPRFTGRADFFRDSDHLNERGARAFSAILRRCLSGMDRAGAGPTPPARDCPAQRAAVASAGLAPNPTAVQGWRIAPRTSRLTPRRNPD